MSEASTRNYRGDIDGLRAIAVFSVVLFHLNPTVVTGGYVGVDMFFVISGYLITRNIRNDLRTAISRSSFSMRGEFVACIQRCS